jgi:hypothetical protein
MVIQRLFSSLKRYLASLFSFNGVFQDGGKDSRPPIQHRNWLLDLFLITVAVLAFCSKFFSVGAASRLPGLEADVFQSLDWALVNSLQQGSFPLWNPYIDTGLPFIADPMLHAYNPVVTIPVLMFGVWHGFKIGLVLSFLLAAFGMYVLAASLGTKRVTRIWLALMFAFAGQPAARFFQGQYLFVFGFAWIPWIVFGYVQSLLYRQRWSAALTAISAALLFFSGNAYYAFLMLISLGIITLVWVVRINTTRPFLRWDQPRLRLAALIGIVSLLIISIQLLPTLDFLPFVNKAADVQGFHNIFQIFMDLTSKDSTRPDAFFMLPAREEFYAYIGYTPFLGLFAIPLVWREKRRWVISLTLILLFTISWISLDRMPWYGWLISQPITHMFRHLLRALLFTSTTILLLGGLGFDSLIRHSQEFSAGRISAGQGRVTTFLRKIPLILLLGLMSYGVVDLFLTNRSILKPWRRPQEIYQVMASIKNMDPDWIYVRYNPNNHGHDAIVANDLRFMMPWYHYTEIRNTQGETRDYFRPLRIEPHYLVTHSVSWIPDQSDWTLLRRMGELMVLKMDHSLPFAFTIPEEEMRGPGEGEPAGRDDVLEKDLLWRGPNQSETIIRSTGDELLILLVSYHPDWRIHIDGKPAESLNASGLLGVKPLPGLHKYSFRFRPTWFYFGLIGSALGFLIIAYWLQSGLLGILASIRSWAIGIPRWLQTTRSHLVIQMEADRPMDSPDLNDAWHLWRSASARLLRALVHSFSWQSALFTLGLAVYIASRLIALEDFPIYFFSDEAVQTVLAADFVRDGFYGYDGIFLPTYFENASLFNLSVSVYLQIIPYMLFGKSIFITRAVPALVTATAVIALGLILKRSFQLRYWWTAPFALGLIPSWFLHSRTAFETTLFVSFTAWTFYFYLEYRRGKTWNLFPALFFGALGFYSYAGAQIVLGAFGLALLLVDWRYHRQHPRLIILAGLFSLILIYPYFRFRSAHAAETYFHLRRLDSYWFHETTTWTKVLTFFQQYLQGLSPTYWFSRFPDDLPRHLMRGYGRISFLASPFLLFGIYKSSFRVKEPEYRTLLLLLLSAPLGGALISIGITRVLLVIIPASILIGIGFSYATAQIKNERLRSSLMTLSFILLVSAQFYMLRDSLESGPTWYRDYGLSGMQYGAKQVFKAADAVASNPDVTRVYVSPTWANGTDILMRFFLPDRSPVAIANAGPFLEAMQPEALTETIFALTPNEYRDLLNDPKVEEVMVERIIDYPDGNPGFYFVRFNYSAEADASFASEQALYESIQTRRTEYRGDSFLIEYPYTDMGELKHIFDDDPFTLMRFYSANPATLALTFDEPISMQGIVITTGSMDIGLRCRVYRQQIDQPPEFSDTFVNLPDDPTVELDFGAMIQDINKIEIEITALSAGTPFKIHLRDLKLR